MLFHTFTSQDERRKFGGSDFLEFQYCTMKQDTKLSEIVSIDAFTPWDNNSLYVYGDDWDEFWDLYNGIIKGGFYANGECGLIDWAGINYYTPEKTEEIIKLLKDKKPTDYQVLLEWLKDVGNFNGFYILGF